MGIILDVVLLIIFSLFIFIGYKKGLVKVIFSLVALIISLILTLILYKPITNIVVENTQIDDNIASAIEEKLSQNINDENQAEEINQFLGKYLDNTKQDLEKGLIKSTSEVIAINIVGIIVLLSLFIVIRIAVTILGMLTNTLAELPLIKQFNKVGGIIYGAIEGLIIIYIILAIVFFIVTANSNVQIMETIDTSYITKMLYENNIIIKILF